MNTKYVETLLLDFQKINNHKTMIPYKKLLDMFSFFKSIELIIENFNKEHLDNGLSIYNHIDSIRLNGPDKFQLSFHIYKKEIYLRESILNIEDISRFNNNLVIFKNFIELNLDTFQLIQEKIYQIRSIESALKSIINKDKDQKIAGFRKYLKSLILDFKNNSTLDQNKKIVHIELKLERTHGHFYLYFHPYFNSTDLNKYVSNPSNILVNYEEDKLSLEEMKKLLPFTEKLPLKQIERSFFIDSKSLEDYIVLSKNMSNF